MNLAGTMTTDDIPPEVLEQMENQETVDFGDIGPDPTDFPGGTGCSPSMPIRGWASFLLLFVAVIGS